MATRRAATHFGECQICGHAQKLPAGRLALHGYAVKWSSFVGTCPGSRALPFELSCDLLADQVRALDAEIERLAAFARSLRQAPAEPKAWFHCYVRSTKRGAEYRYVEATITTDDRGSLILNYTKPTITGSRWSDVPTSEPAYRYSYHAKTAIDLAAMLNAKRAEHGEAERTRVEVFRLWTKERLDSWKLRELRPIAKETV